MVKAKCHITVNLPCRKSESDDGSQYEDNWGRQPHLEFVSVCCEIEAHDSCGIGEQFRIADLDAISETELMCCRMEKAVTSDKGCHCSIFDLQR